MANVLKIAASKARKIIDSCEKEHRDPYQIQRCAYGHPDSVVGSRRMTRLFDKAKDQYIQDVPEDAVLSYLSKKEEEQYWVDARLKSAIGTTLRERGYGR